MRCFFSIPIPAAVATKLLALLPPMRSIRRGKPDHLHLTLHFLASAPDNLPELLPPPEQLKLGPAFTLTPTRVILLPESGPVRILAAGVASSEPLKQLHRVFATQLDSLLIPLEQRPYLPHITLARCDPPLPQQVRGQTPTEVREDLSFAVTSLGLIESRPSAAGFEHVRRQTYHLA